MTYNILASKRKPVVRRLEELAGKRAVYTRAPRMAYIIEGITIERDGTVETEEEANMEMIETLIGEGLIQSETSEAPEESAEAHAPTESTEDEAPSTVEPTVIEIEGPSEEEASTVICWDDLIAHTSGPPKPIRPRIGFPLAAHRAESIINLVCSIYTRGKLISKATGGAFSASEDLVESLRMLSGRAGTEEVLRIIRDEGGISGICFTGEKVIFDGFPATTDADTIRAWTTLSAAINRTAIKQLHVRAREADETNEKFAFRTWLTSLGMNGPNLRAERNILYRNLSGHTAFRTAEAEEKWKKTQAAKRAERKALKAAANTESKGGGAKD